MNYILIGIPTAGKSTVGVVLAKMLGYDYLDTDLLIQKKQGRRLEDTINAIGQEAFLDLEGDVCAGLMPEKTIIATGGSVIYRTHAMEHLKSIGTVIYLKIGLETLLERLHDAQSRGVVLKEGQTLQELYNERIALYEKYADIVVDEGNLSFEEVLKAVTAAIQQAGDAQYKRDPMK